jgi:hypothetical protein
MKRTTFSLKSCQPAVVATLVIVVAWEFSVRVAQAGYIVTLEQVGPNVIATGSGALDLTGLSFDTNTTTSALVDPSAGIIQTGATSSPVLLYTGANGPDNFGSGGGTTANSSTGDFVGILGFASSLALRPGYVPGTALSDTSTYDSATFTTLGVTPGTYEWTWGGGADQNFTLDVVAPAVPECSVLRLLLLSLTGLLGVIRFRLA